MIAILLTLMGCGQAPDCVGHDRQPRALRRLTPLEYERSVSDLLHIDATGLAPDVGDPVVGGFRNDAASMVVGPTLADQYLVTAEALVERASIRELLPCNPDTIGEEPCAAQFVLDFGRRALRHPLTRPDLGRYLRIFQITRETATFDEAVGWVVITMLQSPHFLYRSELGVHTGGGRFALTDWEMATALSYTLWGTTPSDALLDAAAHGALTRDEDVARTIDEMLQDPRAKGVIVDFVTSWLGLEQIHGVTREGLFYEDRPELLEATQGFLSSRAGGTLGELMAGGDLLTDPTVLTVHARTTGSSPVHRGLLVRERLLCEELPEPPPNIDLSLPDPRDVTTTRAMFATHATNPACAECHDQMDPIGVAFEHYDQLGRYRTEENGYPVDASGELDGVPVGGIEELAAALIEDRRFRSCFVQSLRRYATGMPSCGDEVPASTSLLEPLRELLGGADHRVRKGGRREGDTLAIDAVDI